MRKKNKLYTVNRFNKPLFMPYEPEKKENLYGFGSSFKEAVGDLGSVFSADGIGKFLGSLTGNILGTAPNENSDTSVNADPPKTTEEQMAEKAAATANVGQGFALGGPIRTPKGNEFLLGGIASAVGGAVGNAISGGYSSTAGNVLNTVGDVVGKIPGFGTVAGVGLKVLSGGVNALFGTKVDQAKLQAANKGTAAYNNFMSNAKSFDAIKTATAQANVQNAYSSGLLNRGWAAKRNAELKRQRVDARQFAGRSIANNVANLQSNQINDALANYSAFGGPIGFGGGALDYDLMSNLLTIKNKNADNRNQMTNLFMGSPNSMFAFGGDLQTHGADWPTKLTHIDAGQSHEENPNDGVQMGVDSEGVPNLVEENETIFNDYVFSARILADEATKKLFHLPKKKDITFAEISKKLEKEIAERPTDPISQAGFKAQMQTLEEQQERQKQEMEAEKAKAAFEALSPEEQAAVMQRAAQEEQMAQEQAASQQLAQEQATAEQQALQQPTPEEAAMAQQQIQPELSPEDMLAQQQAQVAALGGQLVKAGDVVASSNKFAVGGRKARKVAEKYNGDWFRRQARLLGIDDKYMEQFEDVFNPNDPEANLAAFNSIYARQQKDKDLATYMEGQRKAKENELFGENGMYRMSDDNSKVYKARIRKDGEDWINANGDILDQEAYEKLSDSDKEAYKQIRTRVGDKLYDYNNKLMEEEYKEGKDALLDSFAYDKGFKWNDKDALTLQYPADMEHSNLSYLRYAPALGGAVGLLEDAFTSPDYSRAEAVIRAGNTSTPTVSPRYIGNYLTYKPMDIWFQQNAMNAQARATDRALLNSFSPSRAAGLLANGYNSQLASGNLYRQELEYNDALKKQVEEFNRGTNQFNAQMGLSADKSNQEAALENMRRGFYGTLYGNQMMDAIDARRAADRNANLTNLLQSIGNIGEEAYDEDRLKWLERTGVLRSNYYGQRSAAKGGKLNKKKKGLTY